MDLTFKEFVQIAFAAFAGAAGAYAAIRANLASLNARMTNVENSVDSHGTTINAILLQDRRHVK